MAKSKKDTATAEQTASAPATEEKKVALTKLRGPRGVPETAKITVLADGNPKRPGSKAHAAFACYHDGMSVGAFCDAVNAAGQQGMGTPNLVYDATHGFIKIEGYNPELAPVREPKAPKEPKPVKAKKEKPAPVEKTVAEADAGAKEEVMD